MRVAGGQDGALYLNEVMSVYRFQTPGSWTAAHADRARGDEHMRKSIAATKALEAFFGDRCRAAIRLREARIHGKFVERCFMRGDLLGIVRNGWKAWRCDRAEALRLAFSAAPKWFMTRAANKLRKLLGKPNGADAAKATEGKK